MVEPNNASVVASSSEEAVMFSSHCVTALRATLGMGMLAAVAVLSHPAEARRFEPGYQGPLSNGVFSGLPIRADAVRQHERRPAEIVGDNCYVVYREGKSASGRTISYKMPICE
jgi:hypothetical protein